MDRSALTHPQAERARLVGQIGELLGRRTPGGAVGVVSCRLDDIQVSGVAAWPTDPEAVAAVAGRLGSLIRDQDLSGWLGTEQLIIATDAVATERDLRALADRLLAATLQPLRLRGGSTRLVSLSIGVATTIAVPGAGAETLLDNAAEAMAEAWREGGDRYVLFDTELGARSQARRQLRDELSHAVHHRDLEVHYQPVVELATGTVHQVEALVRWPHPVRGMVHPWSFLPVAAEAGLLAEIGEQVLDLACRQSAAWTSAIGRPVTVSVNVSDEQLFGSDLRAAVARALGNSGLHPSQLQLEIAESLVGHDTGPVSAVVRRLATTGVGIVLDGAGGGPATFRRLAELPPVSTVKLDPALVGVDRTGQVDVGVLASAARRAADNELLAVATGVESTDQLELVRRAGLEQVQGFLLQRPSVARHVMPLLVTGCPIP